MRIFIVTSAALLSLSACSTTQREEVRADRANVEKQARELEGAKRDGTINEVREERKDLRQAEEELREDQKQLYRPGSEGSAAAGLQVGQRESGELSAVPPELRSRYQDGNGSYYRYDGLRIYQLDVASRTVVRVFPLNR
jgi:hypothetical protein